MLRCRPKFKHLILSNQRCAMGKFSPILISIVLTIFIFQPMAKAQDSAEISGDNFAEPARSQLVVPDDIWTQVRDSVGYSNRPLGYTADEMEHFGVGSDCILRNVEMLFRDITSVPQFSGRMGDIMLGNPSNFANSTFNAFKLLDAYAARQMSYAVPAGWEVEWIPEDAPVDDAFEILIQKNIDSGIIHPIWDDDMAQWNELPDEIKRLVVRILIAAEEASPWIKESFDENFYKNYFNVDNIDRISYDQLYEFASWPWHDDSPDPAPRESFEALKKFDIKHFATGSNEFMRMTWGAIEEYKQAVETSPSTSYSFEYCEFRTALGNVGIFGHRADNIDGDFQFIFDLGGSDTYTGMTAVPKPFSKPFGIVIDLAGNDDYSTDTRAGLACGNHGIGAIFDLKGNDNYNCAESGIGCAWYGTGLVVDYGGDDEYISYNWGQAAAHAGIGMLIDINGDDYYECMHESQAFGSTFGVGALIDVDGDDIYYADPNGDPNDIFEQRTVHFAQGTGFGRRADFGDGHSLGGGIGMLIEGDGDDVYTGSVYSQGAGYWWALGILEDRGGNDSYFNEQYSCGSAPHFAIGCLVDLTGDDRYNVGNVDVERQIQGHARDGSFAVFIDGSGDDQYFLPNLAAGSSDLNCLTLFWDRMGDDNYIADRNPPRGTAYSFGDSTRYSPFHTFRDKMASIGVFLDTGGSDVYSENDPPDPETAANLNRIPFENNFEWMQRIEHPNYGYGLDTNYFSGFIPIEEEVFSSP